MTCWRGAALRVLAALVVLVAALPSSAAAGAAAASPPPPTDMGLLVARLERLEAEVRAQARETRQARADARELEWRVAELEAERRGEEQEAGERESQQSAETWRCLQAPPTPRGDIVHIHRANVSLPAGPTLLLPDINGDSATNYDRNTCIRCPVQAHPFPQPYISCATPTLCSMSVAMRCHSSRHSGGGLVASTDKNRHN
eukprot:COSAG01_NODE_20558_length_946_cov_0.782097_1_plen_201_part_00